MDNQSRIKAIESYFSEAREISHALSGSPCYRWSRLENKLGNIRYILSTAE